MNSAKPLPAVLDPDARTYWSAAKQHRLSLQQCDRCSSFLYPPGPACPVCGAAQLTYKDLGSNITGKVYSYIVPHRAFVSGFAEEAPYAVLLVDVDQAPGVKILANLVNSSWQSAKIGMSVRMVWEDRTSDVAIPQWESA